MNDLKKFKYGEEGTHTVCNKRLKEEGVKSKCCVCDPHEDCDINSLKKYSYLIKKPNYEKLYKELVKRLEKRIKFCEKQNGISECKNCLLNRKDWELK